MKFEEEFPNLKVIGYPLLIKGSYDMAKDIFGQFVSCAQVQKYTLSKQRVKEAQEKVLSELFQDEWQDTKHLFYELNKELGLED